MSCICCIPPILPSLRVSNAARPFYIGCEEFHSTLPAEFCVVLCPVLQLWRWCHPSQGHVGDLTFRSHARCPIGELAVMNPRMAVHMLPCYRSFLREAFRQFPDCLAQLFVGHHLQYAPRDVGHVLRVISDVYRSLP